MDQGLSVPWKKGYSPLERKRLPTCRSGAVCSLDEGVLTLRGRSCQRVDQGLCVPWMKGYLPLDRKKLPTCGSGAVCSLEEGVLTLREEEAANL